MSKQCRSSIVFFGLIAGASMMMIACGSSKSSDDPSPGEADVSTEEGTKLVSDFCIKCHGAGSKFGELNSPSTIKLNAAKAVSELEANTMPTSRGAQPSSDQRKKLIAFFKKSI